jgi:uncharacterized Zn finger protein (UPF0148 family)
LTTVKISRINNFICPACGEVMNQVAAKDGVVKGWCPVAKREINVVVSPVNEEEIKIRVVAKPINYFDSLSEQRDKVLKDVVSPVRKQIYVRTLHTKQTRSNCISSRVKFSRKKPE